MLTRPLADVVRDLNAQQHRRFIKSHTPLDGLPFDERVTYICIGRDPRDVAISFDHHMANMDVNAFLIARYLAVGLDDLGEAISDQSFNRLESERERFWQWIDAPASRGLPAMMHHLSTFWEVRKFPNVVLLHFSDLKADLPGQMRCLAARLGVKLPEELWHELVQAATFEEMRGRADDIVPNATEALWHDNARFFNTGANGQWRELLDEEDLRRYQVRVLELAPVELATWIHQGPVIV
jgi:hypothetical protein